MSQVYVKMDGRLGNQMFQYAFGRQMQELTGGCLILDFTSQRLNESKGNFGHDGISNSLVHFNVKPYRYIDLGNFDKSLIPFNQRYLFKMARFFKPMTRRQWWVEIFEFLDHWLLQFNGIYFLESVNATKYLHWPKRNKSLFIRSWAESEQYFYGIANQLREEFTPKYPIPDEHQSLYNILKGTESICVSVRRGDFVSSAYAGRYLVCTKEYYEKGVEYIRSKKNNALVFVCSDDVEWCKNNFNFGDNVIFEPDGLAIWDKMRFMSACHHFVISNSTFSWWCQYLSPYDDKIVVAPPVWRKTKPEPKDIYQKNWIVLKME